MEPDELLNLISQPESEILEYKAIIPESIIMARLIAGFANTKGGNIVIGVREEKDGNRIIGVDVERVERILHNVHQKITPSIEYKTDVVTVEEKSVVVVTVPKGKTSPYLVDNQAFLRKGETLSRITVIAPDVFQSAYDAVTSGSPAAALGSGTVTAGDNGIFVGGNIYNIAIARPDFVPYDIAYERIVGSTASVTTQLELNNSQIRGQSQGWYQWSIIAAVLGFLLFIIGVVAIIFGKTTAGIITTIAGIIPEVVAGLFFRQSKQANERVDTIQKNLTDAHKMSEAVEIANTMSNVQDRDKLKAEIVRKALRIK